MSICFLYKVQLNIVTILQGYGLTESSGSVSFTKTVEENRHYGTTGLLSANVTAKVVDTASGKPLPPNHKGQLWLRGSTIMKGSSCIVSSFPFKNI